MVQMDCVGNECGLPLSIWASMVPRSAALDIAEVCTPFLRRSSSQHLALRQWQELLHTLLVLSVLVIASSIDLQVRVVTKTEPTVLS